jgi:hypothetical protein
MNVRWLTPALLLWGCNTCGEAKVAPPAATPPPAAPTRPARQELAEVEMGGTWSPGEVKPAKVLFTAQLEPCLPVPEKPTRYGEKVLKEPGGFFDEYFIPQDSKGHLCLYGLDEAGTVVGAASYAKNPLRFWGQGEIIYTDVDFTLAPVP